MDDKEKIDNNDLEENPFSQEVTAEEASEAEEKPSDEEDEFSKLGEELENQKSQYIRLAADFDNYRKRQEQEREALLKYGAEDTLKKLLPVLDTIERAKKSFQEIEDCQQLKQSFEAIEKQFFDSLDKIGVTKIETVGKEFDPNLHEAVMQTQTDEHDDHSIVTELQSGYKLQDRVVRPAMVNVAVKD